MCTQELEEHDFSPLSELNNCLREACDDLALKNGVESVKILAAVGLGRFVVIGTSPYLCRATDAIAGTLRRFMVDFISRSLADAECARLMEGCGGFGDEEYSVVPALPPVVTDSARMPVSEPTF